MEKMTYDKDKVIHWNHMDLVVRDFEHSHANGGRLNKFWAEDLRSGRIFLIKGSSPLGKEPFSEKLAYIIGKNLGIDVLEYNIIPAYLFKDIVGINPFCKYLSICEKIDKQGYSITSIAEVKRARNALIKDKDKKITNKEVMYELLDKNYIDTMLLFDAIIGNTDRHYGNVHLLRGIDGKIIGAPILDNGASLLAMNSFIKIIFSWKRIGEKINKSFTLDKTHDKQLINCDSINNISFNIATKTIKILNEIEPTLKLMSKTRAKIVKRYIVYRLHKYLGMLKYTNNEVYINNQKDF